MQIFCPQFRIKLEKERKKKSYAFSFIINFTSFTLRDGKSYSKAKNEILQNRFFGILVNKFPHNYVLNTSLKVKIQISLQNSIFFHFNLNINNLREWFIQINLDLKKIAQFAHLLKIDKIFFFLLSNVVQFSKACTRI